MAHNRKSNGLTLNRLSIEDRLVSSLKGYPRNARTHSRKQLQQLVASLQEFGFNNPILIDPNDEMIAEPRGRNVLHTAADVEETRSGESYESIDERLIEAGRFHRYDLL